MFLKNNFLIFFMVFLVIQCPISMYAWGKFFKPSSPHTLHQLKQHGSKVVTLVFDPAGKSGPHQRMIDGISEQTITYQLVLNLKKKLEENNPYLRVIILRDTKSDDLLQHISAANQTQANLYINFQAYQNKRKKNSLDIYHMLYRDTDTWGTTEKVITFLPIDLSHKLSIKKTLLFEKIIFDEFDKGKSIQVMALGLPMKPLMGLILPSLVLELGLLHNDSYELFIEPLTRAISDIISTITGATL